MRKIDKKKVYTACMTAKHKDNVICAGVWEVV